jgi:hypothetical protein
MILPARLCCPTSENSVMAKFGTYGFAPVLWARNPHERTALRRAL